MLLVDDLQTEMRPELFLTSITLILIKSSPREERAVSISVNVQKKKLTLSTAIDQTCLVLFLHHMGEVSLTPIGTPRLLEIPNQ